MYRKLMFLISLVALLSLANIALADDIEWDAGGDGTSWNDPLNWDPNQVPGPDDRAIVLDPDPNFNVPYLSPVITSDVNVLQFAGPAFEQGEDVNQVMTIDGATFTITSPEEEDNWVRDGDFGGDDAETSFWEVRLINGARLEIPNGAARLFDHGQALLSLNDSSLYVNGELRAADEDDGYMTIVTTGSSDVNIAEDLFFGDDGLGTFDFGGSTTVYVGRYLFLPGRQEDVLGMKGYINIRDSAVVNVEEGIGVQADKDGEATMNVYGGTVTAGFLRTSAQACKGEDDPPEGTGEIFVYDGLVDITDDISIPDSDAHDDAEGSLTQSGGIINCDTLFVGDNGLVELLGGTLNVTGNSLELEDGAAVNIEGGTLKLKGDQQALVATYAVQGVLGAYYDSTFHAFRGGLDVVFDGTWTIVTGIAPNWNQAWAPDPADDAIEVQSVITEVVLSWQPGAQVGTTGRHIVYFGTTYDAVDTANPGSDECVTLPPLMPAVLSWNAGNRPLWSQFFWRVDECNSSMVCEKGVVWTFTTGCEAIPGDLNKDCLLNFEDFADVASTWQGEQFWPPEE